MKYILITQTILILWGCATNTPKPIYTDRPQILLAVPFIKQKKNYCGPATIAMVSHYYGRSKSQDWFAGRMITPQKMGTLPFDMISVARREGFVVKKIHTVKDIVNSLYAKTPVIALVNAGNFIMPVWHYLIIIGFDPSRQQLILHSDQNWKIYMSTGDFAQKWEAYDQWAIAISPLPKVCNPSQCP